MPGRSAKLSDAGGGATGEVITEVSFRQMLLRVGPQGRLPSIRVGPQVKRGPEPPESIKVVNVLARLNRKELLHTRQKACRQAG